uniref:Uncharacterized protein n=1 Tax=Mycena chlorophos TaxID=658473 RepID=A0ABQ0LNK9_MYCCL|nr:predicted protein [Mycena chlorophos]
MSTPNPIPTSDADGPAALLAILCCFCSQISPTEANVALLFQAQQILSGWASERHRAAVARCNHAQLREVFRTIVTAMAEASAILDRDMDVDTPGQH